MTRQISPIVSIGKTRSAALTTLLCVAGVVYAGEVEPNDTLSTATRTGLVDFGTVCIGGAAIGNGPLGAADRDLFSIIASPAATIPLRVTVELTSPDPDFDGYVRLFRNEDGLEFARNDDASRVQSDSVLYSYALVPSTYFIGVSHALDPIYSPLDPNSGRAAGVGLYDLCITLSPADSLGDSIEQDGEVAALIGRFPYERTSQFIGDGPDGVLDVDRFAAIFETPGILTVRVSPAEIANGEPYALDPLVTVNIDGREFEQNASVRADDPAVLVEAAIVEPGEIEVQIRGTRAGIDLTTTNARYGSVGFYDIFIDATFVAPQAGPHEANDSVLQSTPADLITVGTLSFSAVIGDGTFGEFRGDQDFYAIRAPAGRRVSLDIVPSSATDPIELAAQLYDHLGVPVVRWITDESHEIHAAVEVRCRNIPFGEDPALPNGPVYYVAISGARDRPSDDPLIPNPDPTPGSSPQSFPLHVLDGGAGSSGTYELSLSLIDSQLPACGQEPDESISQLSGPILVGEGTYSCTRGMINDGPCTDTQLNVDLYEIMVAQTPATLRIRLFLAGCGNTRVLRVFDVVGQELAVQPSAPLAYDIPMVQALSTPGKYHVGVSRFGNVNYDPNTPCSGATMWGDLGLLGDRYELEIQLSHPQAPEVFPVAEQANSGVPSQVLPAPLPSAPQRAQRPRVFASLLDGWNDTLVELDPNTGQRLQNLALPESPLGGNEGLAFDGDDLFVSGRVGRYPVIYRVDPDTGVILQRAVSWFGSGVYGQMVFQAGKLFIPDLLEKAIYVADPGLTAPIRRLNVGTLGIAMRRPIAASSGADRLYVVDAVDPTTLHALESSSGALLDSSALPTACLCDADFDADGDVDGVDESHLSVCAAFGCFRGDLDCDGDIDSVDSEIFWCQFSGAGNPPHKNCCPPVPPFDLVRSTSVGIVGPNVFLSGNWTEPVLRRFSPTGQLVATLVLDAPVGAIAGYASFPFADPDADGDVDLLDWSEFQICFAGPDVGAHLALDQA